MAATTTAASVAVSALPANPALAHAPPHHAPHHVQQQGQQEREAAALQRKRTVVKRKAPPALKALAGSIGGLTEALFLQPVDTIKTRMQLNAARCPGMISSGQTIVAEEGVPALWKGLTPFATHLFTKYALRFGTNATFQSWLADDQGRLTDGRRLIAGLGAGVTEAILIVTPFDVVKIRLQEQHGMDKSKLKYSGPMDAARQIVRQEGAAALWSGVTPTIARNGTQQATMFYFKSVLDSALWGKDKHDPDKKLEVYQSMVSGLLASCPGIMLTNPMDVIKTRLALQKSACGTKGRPHYRGIVHGIYTIAKEEGVGALYRGLLPRLLRVPPGMAITWGVADQFVQIYEGEQGL